MSHLERAVLEMFLLIVNPLCALLAVYFKLFAPASIKRLDCRNKLVSPCKRLSKCHSFRFIASKSRGEIPQHTGRSTPSRSWFGYWCTSANAVSIVSEIMPPSYTIYIIPYHSISFHTIPYHAIPYHYHNISYHYWAFQGAQG